MRLTFNPRRALLVALSLPRRTWLAWRYWHCLGYTWRLSWIKAEGR